jgi:hypothetical protein
MKRLFYPALLAVTMLGLIVSAESVFDGERTLTYQDQYGLQHQEVPSWLPDGYEMVDTERRLAFHWTKDVECPKNKKCLGLKVYTDTGCEHQLIVHGKFANDAGIYVDDSVLASATVRPQSFVTLLFASDAPRVASVEIIGVSCS